MNARPITRSLLAVLLVASLAGLSQSQEFAPSALYPVAPDYVAGEAELLATLQNLRSWEKNGVDPVERLLQLQNPSGAFRFSDAFPGDNAFATFQAGPAVGLTRCVH